MGVSRTSILRRSRDGAFVRSRVRAFVCPYRVRVFSRFRQLLRCAHKSTSRGRAYDCSINTIPYDSVKNSAFIHAYFC